MDLKITQDGNKFTLDGIINEFAKFQPLFDFEGPEIILNLKNISRINSTGVREWINAIEKINTDIAIFFEDCPPVVVYQMTMIPNFTARAKVLSVYAPFYCAECGNQEDILITMEGFNLDEGLPEVKCKECGEAMEFDDDEESYFYFMELS
ncbi:MAG: hypothetical protein HQM12_03545 [SAR324 cluster bacterium]|nr:hypothetical protein [SAR324 cluster bacterium]MBF0350716.1 hypothetical protein [SAR324 cluster bacterium]